MKIYAHIIDESVTEYPITEENIRQAYPGILFSAINFIPPVEYQIVTLIDEPANTLDNVVVEGTPTLINGVWTQNWIVTTATPEVILQREKTIAQNNYNSINGEPLVYKGNEFNIGFNRGILSDVLVSNAELKTVPADFYLTSDAGLPVILTYEDLQTMAKAIFDLSWNLYKLTR